MSIIVFVILNIMMLLSSHLAAYKYFGKESFSRQLITVFLLFTAQVTFSILFLGVIVKNLSIIAIFTLNAAISSTIIFILRKSLRVSINEFFRRFLNFLKYLLETRDYFLYFLLLLFGIQIVILLIKIYYLPPSVWDVFTYHLHPVVEWYQQGKIPLLIETPVERINFRSFGSGLLLFWLVRFFRDITYLELPQFISGILIMLSSYSLMLKINVRKNDALRYAVLIYFIPAVLIQSRTCQNHLVFTAIILVTMLYFTDVFIEKRYSHIIFLSLAFGLLLGAKLNSPQVIFIFFLSLLLCVGFGRKSIVKFIKENRVKIACGILIIIAVGGYWHIKNIILFKSPTGDFVPIVYSVDSPIALLHWMQDAFTKNILNFPSRILDDVRNYVPDLTKISGFGVQFFVFGLIGYAGMIVLAVWKKAVRQSSAGYFLVFSILLLFSYFLYYYDDFNYRLLIFFPVFGIILWAFLLSHVGLDSKRFFSNYLGIIISAMLLFNIIACFYPGHTLQAEMKWKRLFTVHNPMERTPIKYFPYFNGNHFCDWNFIDQYMDPAEPIGYAGSKDSWIFQYFDNQLKRRIYYLGALPGFELTGRDKDRLVLSPGFKAALRERNIHFLHFSYRKRKIIIEDKDVEHIVGKLYYYKW